MRFSIKNNEISYIKFICIAIKFVCISCCAIDNKKVSQIVRKTAALCNEI